MESTVGNIRIKHSVLREFVKNNPSAKLDCFKVRDADMGKSVIHYIDYYDSGVPKYVHESWIYDSTDERNEDFVTLNKLLR